MRVNKDKYILAWREINEALVELTGSTECLDPVHTDLCDLADEYRDQKRRSRDSWLTKVKLRAALIELQESLIKSGQVLDHPQIVKHLFANGAYTEPEQYKKALSEIESAARWSLIKLDSDFETYAGETHTKKRQTRVTVRNEFLIPRLTKLYMHHTGLSPLEDSSHLRAVESLVLTTIEHWADLTGVEGAKAYSKMPKKPFRRLVMAVLRRINEGDF